MSQGSEGPEGFEPGKNKYFDIFGFLATYGCLLTQIKSPLRSFLGKCHFGDPIGPEGSRQGSKTGRTSKILRQS